MNTEREFPNWEQLYQEKEVETMPWFNPEIDPDLDRALTKLNLQSGTALDIGTGPGTQAMALALLGFKVTGTDLSAAAVSKAEDKAKEKGLDIIWKQDDILNSKLEENFDIIFDRGCFHVLPPEQRQDYVLVVDRLIKPNGYLFLKCFSHKETREAGPYRFTQEEIKEIFSSKFNVCDVQETVYHGTLEQLPLALFCVLQK
ncbi:class I SAM-dependent methyltransferase [Argonema galeatum]|uniref:class I SAM-dependent methyltransferase n=1 Tax=Argonema galeatum TaxID=2942762 RepID=UPI002011500D|nr:class I SAM-dependent methyltransferase [Argonema galeatum]MCL1465986.1 class I SAM-dependent methyltransferase [Argonema galeatum A003/A1]